MLSNYRTHSILPTIVNLNPYQIVIIGTLQPVQLLPCRRDRETLLVLQYTANCFSVLADNLQILY